MMFENQYNFRVDHNWSPNQRTFVRGTRDSDTHQLNGIFNDPDGPSASHQILLAYLFALGHTWTVSPSFLIQFTYGFAYQQNHQFPDNYFNYSAANYGFSSNFVSQEQIDGVPIMSVSGITPITSAGVSYNSFDHYVHSLEVSATFLRGKHSIIAGYDGRYILENEQSLGNPVGTFKLRLNPHQRPQSQRSRSFRNSRPLTRGLHSFLEHLLQQLCNGNKR